MCPFCVTTRCSIAFNIFLSNNDGTTHPDHKRLDYPTHVTYTVQQHPIKRSTMNLKSLSPLKLTLVDMLTVVIAICIAGLYVVQDNPSPFHIVTSIIVLIILAYINARITAEKSRRLYEHYDLENATEVQIIPQRTTPEE